MKGSDLLMRKKIRIYLDTSVISYLDQKDAPQRMKETHEVWEILKANNYEVVVSSIALSEISECSKEKAEKLVEYLSQINYLDYQTDKDTEVLADLVIQENILKPKSKDDALHIASAILSDSDIILSWNFKHLVNIETINGVRKICFNRNFNKIIDIYSPNILLKKEDDEND